MNWRQLLGLKPTEAALAEELIESAAKSGDAGWVYDANDSSLKSDGRFINLANIYREYAQAGRLARPELLDKYRAMLAPVNFAKVPELWTLAQTHIFPLVRSRYERLTFEIKSRTEPDKAIPPRTAQPYLSTLDLVIGYDHVQTVTQVLAKMATAWGPTLEDIIARAIANLRALATPRWQPVGPSVWRLESPQGYAESFLLSPKVFETLPARGTPYAMIPNRGVLLATGNDESGGLTSLLTLAKQSLQEAPWPLSGELFRVLATGAEVVTLGGTDSELLATTKRIDLASIDDAQKTALQAHFESIGDDVFVATYGLLGKKDSIATQSWCSWTQGVRSLLPITDTIAFVWNLESDRKTLLVSRRDAERVVGHYFKATSEDPPRVRVVDFPTAEELEKLKLLASQSTAI